MNAAAIYLYGTIIRRPPTALGEGGDMHIAHFLLHRQSSLCGYTYREVQVPAIMQTMLAMLEPAWLGGDKEGGVIMGIGEH
jgi:hypothetical protein